ncbi:MAG: Gfo/Idh/MocA family oxidoreductase [Firmicutes bacterium]|nr:Gfo/Idh/MocA family oxidoreductase [Bacillota bacterium]
MKLALIGCGYMGQRHALTYQALAEATESLHLLVSDTLPQRAEALARRIEGPHCSATSVALDEVFIRHHPDAVDVCTPPQHHATFVLQALKQQLPVFCEKPLTSDPQEEEVLLQANQRSTGWLAVGYPYRLHPAMKWIGEQLDAHSIGNPYWAILRLNARGGRAWWKHGQEGGVATELLCHLLDLSLGWFGPITEAKVLETHLLLPMRNVEGAFRALHVPDEIVFSVDYACGVHAVLIGDMSSQAFVQSIEIQGKTGGLWGSVQPEWPALMTQLHPDGRSRRYRVDHPAVDLLQLELEQFVEGVRRGQEPKALQPVAPIAPWLQLIKR